MIILFLDILADDPAIYQENEIMLQDYGGYSGLIKRGIGAEHYLESLKPGLCNPKEVQHITERLTDFDGIIVSGSIINIGPDDQIKTWQENVFNLIRQAVKLAIPTIGFCGGHQFGDRALTSDPATVIKNPLGRNFGTSSVKFTTAGVRHNLFKGCSNTSLFQWSHKYIANKLPAGSIVLAHHPLSYYAAFQYQSFIGLQWHPELGALPESEYGARIMRDIALARKNDLINSQFVADEQGFEKFLKQAILPAPASALIIKNWLNMLKNK